MLIYVDSAHIFTAVLVKVQLIIKLLNGQFKEGAKNIVRGYTLNVPPPFWAVHMYTPHFR